MTIGKAFYMVPFENEIFITETDGKNRHFEAIYFDSALEFFDKNRFRKCDIEIIGRKTNITIF